MGAQRGMTVAGLLFVGLVLATGVSGQKVPCMNTREKCQSTGFSSISIINNNYYCCSPGYSMSVINTKCHCIRTAEAVKCVSGPLACRDAASLTSDGRGNTLCCPQGFNLQSQMTSINGLTSRSCTCTRFLFGSGGSFQGMSFGSSGDINATALAERFQNWQHRFRTAMNHGTSFLQNSMQAMGRHMQGLRNHMAGLFNTMFRG